MTFWKQIVRMQLHKRLNARGLAPQARFELATLRLTVAALIFATKWGFRWFAIALILRPTMGDLLAFSIATKCDSF